MAMPLRLSGKNILFMYYCAYYRTGLFLTIHGFSNPVAMAHKFNPVDQEYSSEYAGTKVSKIQMSVKHEDTLAPVPTA